PDDAPIAELVVDAKIPVEILLEGVKLGQLYYPGEVTFRVVAGHHTVRLYTNGQPTDLPLDLTTGHPTRILVGRTGVTTGAPAEGSAPAATGPSSVEFRFVGGGAAQVRVEATSHPVEPGRPFTLELAPGVHPMSVRSTDGTVIWATGTLEVATGRVVVQVTEGRMPEVSGDGVFHAGGS
ncbi:MAG: hypothetical protein ABMB14_21165, partial [Myxococcota bacterium]